MPRPIPHTDNIETILSKYTKLIIAIPIAVIISLCPLILYLSQGNYYVERTADENQIEPLFITATVQDKEESNLELEVADTTEAQRRGLMYRQDLEKNRGMLFIFNDTKLRSFWMKNTEIPLDIAFLDQDKKIINIERNTIPLSTYPTYDSKAPTKYVIETNADWFSENNVSEGDVFIFYSN